MIYVLLMLFPLAIAAGCFILRRQARLVSWISVATVAVEGWLAVTAPIDQPARLLDLAINYTPLGQLVLVTACLGTLLILLLTAYLEHGEYFVATLLLILSLAAAIMIVQEPFVIATLLLLASLIGSVQLVDQPLNSVTLIRPQTLGMALKYTLMAVLGGLLLLVGFMLATAFEQQLATTGPTLRRVIFGLLLVGFSIRAGLIPFHLWLPDLVDETPPPIMFVQAGLLTVLALPVLLVALQTQPELLVGNTSGQRLLIGIGALSTLLGAAAALMTYHPRRAIAFLAIANMGLLTIGLGLSTANGIASALLGALNHMLALALITLGLALLERPVPGRREQAGGLRERPLAALAFVLGVLVLLGVPPFSGFVPRLMLLAAAQTRGWPIGVLVVAGLVLFAMGAARLLRRVLLQPREGPTTRSLFSDDLDRLAIADVPYAPWPLLVVIVGLAIGTIVAGVWPQPIVVQLNETIRSLTFLPR